MADSSTTPYEGLCPWCKAPMSVGALLCIKCGYHLKLRTKVSLEAEPQLDAVRDPANPYRSPGLRVAPRSKPHALVAIKEFLSRCGIRGRMPRWKWWLFQLSAVALVVVLAALKDHQQLRDALMTVANPIFLGLLIYSHAKRWHDLNHSAWWVLLHLIPMGSLYTFIVLGFARGTYGANRFGDDPIGRE